MRAKTTLAMTAVACLWPVLAAAEPPQARPANPVLPEERLADLRAGRGMGLALAAELNGYPGPRHVLELADPLGLSDQQRAQTQALFDDMMEGATRLGERIIAQEQALADLFAEDRAEPEEIRTISLRIGALEGLLRAHHLRYHLEMKALLEPAQIVRYQELRGHAAPGTGGPRHHQGGHRSGS